MLNNQLFRFDPEWVQNEEFYRLVIKWWHEVQLSGDIGSSWHDKMKKLRKKIKGWNKNFNAAKHRLRK
jgi:hypothetical protein